MDSATVWVHVLEQWESEDADVWYSVVLNLEFFQAVAWKAAFSKLDFWWPSMTYCFTNFLHSILPFMKSSFLSQESLTFLNCQNSPSGSRWVKLCHNSQLCSFTMINYSSYTEKKKLFKFAFLEKMKDPFTHWSFTEIALKIKFCFHYCKGLLITPTKVWARR